MKPDTILLRQEVREKVSAFGSADIVVGIPSYNNARTIGHVVKAVQVGLAKYFPGCRTVLINSDGGSSDGTMDVVHAAVPEDADAILLSHRVEPVLKIATPYHGTPGKGSAFRTIFEIAKALSAKACAVVDSDLRSITPEWIELLIKPVLEGGYDYVAPLYKRHKYDGTITNSIIYPLTRALYGKQVRQPIGGDFGFSGGLAGFYLTKDVWQTDVARYGIDIWMTTTAIANNFRISQAFLGAKIHDSKDPGADLSSMLYQVVGSTFDLMETYSQVWKGVKGSKPVKTFGFQYAVGLEPVSVNLARMVEAFRLGLKELYPIWKDILSNERLRELEHASGLPIDAFYIPDDVWVDTVLSFAIAAHRRVMHREHILKALTPLYLGRTASFVIETQDSDANEVEDKIERLCEKFEAAKGPFIIAWDK